MKEMRGHSNVCKDPPFSVRLKCIDKKCFSHIASKGLLFRNGPKLS